MITVEDKIRTFSKYVYDKEVKQKEEVLQKENTKQEQLRSDAEKQIYEKNEKQLVKQKKKLDLEAQRILSVSKQKARHTTNQIKKKIQKDLNASVRQAIVSYATSEQYYEQMEKQLSETLNKSKEAKTVVGLTKQDQERLYPFFQEKFPAVVMETLEADSLGGARVEFPDLGIRVDLTLESKLEDIENELGLEMNEVLNEAVKANE